MKAFRKYGLEKNLKLFSALTAPFVFFGFSSCASRKFDNTLANETSSQATPNTSGTQKAVWSELGTKILNDLKKTNLSSRIPLENLISTNNWNVKHLATGGKIFEEYRAAIGNAKKEVLIGTYFWIFYTQDVQKYGKDTPAKYSYASKMIGEGLIQAQKKLAPGQKLKVSILINEMVAEQLKNDIFRDFLELNEGQLSKVTQVEDSIESWVKMGLDRSKFDFKIAAFEQFLDFNFHDKFMVVDSQKVFMGSSNVKPESNPEPGSQYEVAMVMEGGSAVTAQRYFKDKWSFPNVVEYNCGQKEGKSYCTPIDSAKKTVFEKNFAQPPTMNGTPVPVVVLPADGTNKPGTVFEKSPQNIGWLSAIDNAKNTLEISSPNISAVPFVEKLKAAISRGVKVRMLTAWGHADKEYELLNKVFKGGSSNSQVAAEIFKPFMQTLPRFSITPPKKPIHKHNPIKWYVAPGATKPSFGSGPNVLHAKYLIADDSVVILGSGNQEYFSYFTSSELNAMVDSGSFAKRLREQDFEPMWQRSQDSY